jgi:pimeloyl-ACP methyl ester carboxylesterase
MNNYTRIGRKGRSLVLLHGFLGGNGYWTSVVTALKDHYDVISVDLPGFAGSSHLQAPDSLSGYAATVFTLMDELAITKFSLLGFSMGGMIAQQAALDQPDRIANLVLYGSAAIGDLPNRFESWEDSVERIRREGVEAVGVRTVATWFVDGIRHPNHAACRAACRGADADSCITVMRAMQRWSALDRLQNIKAPSLVIVGDKDRSTRPSESIALWEGIAGSLLCVLPGCAHGAHMEKPDVFNAIVLDFLLKNS